MKARIYTIFALMLFFASCTEQASIEAQTINSYPGQNIGQTQAPDPVKWVVESKKINESERELIFTAKIDKKWHIYSIIPSKDDLGIPTSFIIEESPSFRIIGGPSEPKPKREFDEIVGEYYYHKERKVVFKQKIQALTNDKFTVKGIIEFMACLDEQCLPPDEAEFSILVDGSSIPVTAAIIEPEIPISDTSTQKAAKPVVNKGIPEPEPQVIPDYSTDSSANLSFWGIFIAGFLGGFLALLTPCVFPMIPLTVSFFTKKSKTRAKGIMNALTYGLSIILIYVALGFIITKSLGPDALNALASNVWMNLAFFFIFIIFAISFLGAFEITLPASWVSKADAASDKGGLIGIFFMAFTLSLVSFSCTGPIIGTLLVEAAVGGNSMGPLMGMLGFSTALALPFALFAAFPGWLNSLPKSGGWLNSVKVVLGLLELALALKFLSNVDMAYHWGI
ncbi:MAG: thiol:disulfide interchange protein, partial [Bacteroidetes bacterium]|nr:thiol:disulfide interchange protein [Bacteroidota bacterium]